MTFSMRMLSFKYIAETMAIAVTELLRKDVKMQRKIPKHRKMFAEKLLG